MTTRALIAHALPDGTWSGVWNASEGETQVTGHALIRAVAKAKGNLEAVVAEAIDGCPEGWTSFAKRERWQEPVGLLKGTFDGVIATCEPRALELCAGGGLLYLFHAPKRRLYVFVVADGPMRPFGMVTFDPTTNKAKPTKLPPGIAEDAPGRR